MECEKIMDSTKKEIIRNLISEQILNTPQYISNKFKIEKVNKTRKEFNEIKHFIDKYIEGEYRNRFFLLPGIRSVGKTTILFQIYEYLIKEKNIPSKQILYISYEEVNNLTKTNIREVIDIYLKENFDCTLMTLDKEIFLLIDEVQYDTNWASSGKIIYDKTPNIFMVFTGSSALNLEYNADVARRLIKRTVNPLTYSQYLNLKYNLDLEIGENPIIDLVFHGKVEDGINYEKNVTDKLINCTEYTSDDWDKYLKYGGYPLFLYEQNQDLINEYLNSIVQKVINIDMLHFKTFSLENQSSANRILRFLTLQKPGEVSQANISNYLEISSNTVKSILDTLEKTHLIFHTEPYSSSSTRVKKAWKYNFASSSLRYCLSKTIGNPINNNQLEGILLEDLIASHLHYLKYYDMKYFNLYYDANKKTNVDFIIYDGVKNIIPIEVGRGKKDKRQIKNAMNKYDSSYGIVISNKTSHIKEKEDIIFIPPQTFSYI